MSSYFLLRVLSDSCTTNRCGAYTNAPSPSSRLKSEPGREFPNDFANRAVRAILQTIARNDAMQVFRVFGIVPDARSPSGSFENLIDSATATVASAGSYKTTALPIELGRRVTPLHFGTHRSAAQWLRKLLLEIWGQPLCICSTTRRSRERKRNCSRC